MNFSDTWRSRTFACGVLALILVILYAGVWAYGIASVLLPVATVGSACVLQRRMSAHRRVRVSPAIVTLLAVLGLYVGSFVTFRLVRTFEFSLAPPGTPECHIVIFSPGPAAQEFARRLYTPLRNWSLGQCDYPTGDEMRLLNRDPFTGEPLTLWW